MGIVTKLLIFIVIMAILLYLFDKPLLNSIINSIINIVKNIISTPKINNTTKNQSAFVSNEIKAIENSHLPITINPANTLVFGSFKNTSVRICGQQQSLFGYNSTLMDVKYQDFYVPTIAELEAEYVPNSNYTNLIGQKVYLDFILNNNNNASAPYIINKIYVKGNEVYWIFNQDTGVSNNNAVSIKENITIQMLSPKMVNGVSLLNHTALISPVNPYIDNDTALFSNC